MKFDQVGEVEMITWIMRLVDLPRGDNRAILDKLYNGQPPESEEESEKNNNQVNRNFLQGPNMLMQARGQWNNAMLKQANYFAVSLDSGPIYKRQEWSHSITKNINRQLKRCRPMMEQLRGEGANTILHGIAPSGFKDRRYPIPKLIPVSSLMIPSDTEIDFENLEYFAIFREYTPSMLWTLTHGPRVDPGWNMEAVEAAWKYAREIVMKDTNASALQYMPERWEDLRKQDMGYFGTDAVPTIDVWDFYFREGQDGDGWYRRMFLDWGVATDGLNHNSPQPESRNKSKDKGGFLYTSGKRKFANKLGEILQCQFGDCSAVAPFRYHAVRSLGWMLWGVCDIQNRMQCRFTENVFMQFMWWFRVASQGDLTRIKKAMFEQLGVIPASISMIPAQERFKPDEPLVKMAFEMNQQIMAQNSATFTHAGEEIGSEETATATMAKIHSVNAMVGGMLTLAYEYSKYKYQEIARRFCIPIGRKPYTMVAAFRTACIKDGVPPEMLDAERWDIEPDRALGDGNKMLSLAMVQFMQGIRKNLGPDAQRKVDHISLVEVTDQPALAEDLAPIQGQKKLSPSTHDAQLASDRILRGLPFMASPEMVPEDYVLVWLQDMATIVGQIQQSGGVGDMDKIQGLANLGQHIAQFLSMMDKEDKEDKAKVKQYHDLLGKLMNFIKGFAQRLQQQQQKNGDGADATEMMKLRMEMAKGQAKISNLRESHAIRTAQKQTAFELEQQRKDRSTNADIRREDAKTAQELMHSTLKSLTE